MVEYIQCPDCGLNIPKDTKVCPYCAKPLGYKKLPYSFAR